MTIKNYVITFTSTSMTKANATISMNPEKFNKYYRYVGVNDIIRKAVDNLSGRIIYGSVKYWYPCKITIQMKQLIYTQ